MAVCIAQLSLSALQQHAAMSQHCCGLQVAQVLVESLLQSGASNKVVEIVAGKQVEQTSPDKWFANL